MHAGGVATATSVPEKILVNAMSADIKLSDLGRCRRRLFSIWIVQHVLHVSRGLVVNSNRSAKATSGRGLRLCGIAGEEGASVPRFYA